MMTTFLVIIALSGITETVTGGKCSNVSSGSSCGVVRFCPHPHSDEWKCLKSTMNCNENNGQYYHCAKDVNGCYVQHCAKRVYCNSGQQPLLNLTEDTAMCQTCPAEEYQRRRFWSNEQRECDYAKTKCDGDGEIECHPGTPTEDRTCRCDIHKNLALQGYAYNNRTCCSKDYDQECYCISFKDQCPPGTVRHYNYICLPECPQGSYRQMGAEDCIAENSSSQTYVTSTGQTPLQDSQVSTGIIIGVIVPTVLVTMAAEYSVLRRASILIRVYCLKGRPQRRQNAGDLQNITINADEAFINFGDKNNIQASWGKPESRDLRARLFSTEEEGVSMNPEESRQEESIQSDETSMDTEPKKLVEHEDIHPDETQVKYVLYPPREEADDQTKKKEVWSESVVPDDQTKKKEVWSESVVPDDQTKKKEVWSESVVPDDQTKKKEPRILGSDAEKRQKTEMFQSSGGSMSSRETDIKTKKYMNQEDIENMLYMLKKSL